MGAGSGERRQGGVVVRRERWRPPLRLLLAFGYLAAGVLHLVSPGPFVAITPDRVPAKEMVVTLTGLAEIAGAIALAQPWRPTWRRAAGIGLAIYAVGVFPANVNHMLIDLAAAQPGLGWAYHGPRMLLQPLLVWLALWTGGVLDWPFGRQT